MSSVDISTSIQYFRRQRKIKQLTIEAAANDDDEDVEGDIPLPTPSPSVESGCVDKRGIWEGSAGLVTDVAAERDEQAAGDSSLPMYAFSSMTNLGSRFGSGLYSSSDMGWMPDLGLANESPPPLPIRQRTNR